MPVKFSMIYTTSQNATGYIIRQQLAICILLNCQTIYLQNEHCELLTIHCQLVNCRAASTIKMPYVYKTL